MLITTYCQCQHNSICIYRINRLFSILNALHDPKDKFSYVSTIGGVILNRQIERIQLKKNYKDTTHSAFINYKFRYDVCVDGHIRHMMAYDTISIPRPFDNVCQWYGDGLKEVYKSAIINLDVDCEKETVGYLPGVKCMYSEHVLLLRINGFKLPYEDRDVKHLYEHHHNCSSRMGYCTQFCREILSGGDYKSNNVFHVENEEMVCINSPVSYDKLHDFMVERRSIDEKSKEFSTSTLIPPPSVNDSGGTIQVYVTKLNADLSTNFSSPHTVQDPAYVCYDEEVLNIKLSEPTLSDCFQSCVHRCALLDVLNKIMNDYGGKKSLYNFATFKYYLLAACNNVTTMTSFPNCDNVFYENFILDIVIHSLRMAMKCINDKLA